jgi:hypothetical protein
MKELFTSLIHFPVLNKKGEIVTTSITLFDVHDIARTSYTFGASRFYLINKSPKQSYVLERLLTFWKTGFGREYNENRSEAIDIVFYHSLWEDAHLEAEKILGEQVLTVATSARNIGGNKSVSAKTLRKIREEKPIFLLFGTGWGLSNEILDKVDYILEPIYGAKEYNHLYVRSAAAIILNDLK